VKDWESGLRATPTLQSQESGMSSNSNLGGKAFQQLLASTFAVQESQMDSQFLAGIVEVQRMVTRGELDLDGAMSLVVDSARDVAGAAGTAIGLLERDQLIYRAGSGCSATFPGSRVKASLTASANTKGSGEILRVENAQTDTRVQAAVSRQFGADALLILPIYHERELGGVFEVLFSEAHIFEDWEVRTYRLMAALIETAMGRTIQIDRNLKAGLPTVAQAVDEVQPQGKEYLHEDKPLFSLVNSSGIYQRCGETLAAVRDSRVLRRPALLARIMVQRATEVISNKPLHSLALAAVATGFGLTFWMAHGSRGPASTLGSLSAPGAVAVRGFQPSNEVTPEGTFDSQAAPSQVKETLGTAMRTRRVRLGQDEVDYIGDDVTVRHFNYRPVRQRRVAGTGRVAYIGKDVTVRYFTPKSASRSESR
jgi:hypothetical protein